MPSIKNTFCLLAILAAYGLAAYWDANEEQEEIHASAALPPTASDGSPPHGNTPTPHGVQHAQH